MASWREICRQADEAKHLFSHDRQAGKERFLHLLQKYPNDGMVYLRRGECYESIGSYALALEDYRHAYQAFPLQQYKNQALQAVLNIESNLSHTSRPEESENLQENLDRARELVKKLRHAFPNPSMPEDILPNGVMKESSEYRLFLTLTVAIDYLRDADILWDCARKAFENPKTRYLFDPKEVVRKSDTDLEWDLRSSKLLNEHRDLHTWKTLCRSILEQFKGDPLNIILSCEWDGAKALEHLRRNGRSFPYLKGAKIGPLWLRILRDNAGLPIKNLESIPLPVDIHVLRATFCSGALTGNYEGKMEAIKGLVATLWKKAVQGDVIDDKDGTVRPLVALDLDEALWNLSRKFCSQNRLSQTNPCPLSPSCLFREIEVRNDFVQIKFKMADSQTKRTYLSTYSPSSSRILGILGCTKTKIWDWDDYSDTGPTPARDAYKGSKFINDLSIVERNSSRWIIFSALYGFILPEFVIPEKYDVTFNKPYDARENPTISGSELVRQIKVLHLDSYPVVRLFSSCESDAYKSRVAKAFSGLPVTIEVF